MGTAVGQLLIWATGEGTRVGVGVGSGTWGLVAVGEASVCVRVADGSGKVRVAVGDEIGGVTGVGGGGSVG